MSRSAAATPAAPGRVTLRELARVCARVGAFGFGGGMGMLALVREQMLVRRRWIDETEFGTAVALGQMLPGPFIPNCVEYIGYRVRGRKGMLVAAFAFMLPSVLAILALAMLYFRIVKIPAVQFAFRGVGPVVTAILLVATWQTAHSACRSLRSVSIALLAFLALLFKVDVLLTIVVCGGLGILLNVNFRQHRLYAFVPWLFAPWFVPGAYASLEGTGGWRVLGRAGELFAVFVKLGTIVWGGGFAAIPFIKQEVVDLRLWLSAREFIDGVALSQITPGPVAILATFVGYRTLGLAGAVLATLGFFLPSFLMLLLVLRVYDRIRDHYLVRGFLQGILPAVVGMLLSAALLVGKEAISGIPTGALALVSLLALVLIKLDPVWLVLGGGLVGLLLGARLG